MSTPNPVFAQSGSRMLPVMARKSRLKLPPLDLGDETFGQRVARLRHERGVTQVDLAKKIGIIQVLISDYENDKLRMHAEMVVRFAKALGVSTDELLGVRGGNGRAKLSRKVAQRMHSIETLPTREQQALLKTIDNYIKAAHV